MSSRAGVDEFGLRWQERDVVDLLVLGMSTEEICEALGYTRNSVYTFLKRAYKATNTHHRAALIALVRGK